jgi:GT2 family glycosyltransferase
MDDDAEPKEDALELLSLYFYLDNICALAPLKVDRNMKILQPHRGYFNFYNVFSGIVRGIDEKDIKKEIIEIDHASFVGILIKSKVIPRIGYPKKEFFIYYDDVEYCIRLRSAGKILLVAKSIIFHKEAAKTGRIEKRLLGRKFVRKKFNELWLTYYDIRNFVWLGKKYSENKFLFYCKLVKNLFKQILAVVLIDDNKFKRIRFIINAYLDGLVGNFDNEKPKRILYG